MKQKIVSLLIVIFSLTITSCSVPNLGHTEVIIDWVDFIVLNNIHYLGNYHGSNDLTEVNVGEEIGVVKFNVSENIKRTDYKIKDGDAAFLPAGTMLYKIKGYKPEFRIAAYTEGGWRIYEADSNPSAKKGKDLLDISGKVSYIGINSETDGVTELAAIKGKADIENLVDMIVNAEVNQSSQDHNGQRYFLAFHLLDGTNITRCYWIDSGELSRGILLPKEFGIEINKALTSKGGV